ncbi:MAG: hypothetical protein ACJAV5_001685 [Vicingaceae bacterium]|jgi:hypothetical protein
MKRISSILGLLLALIFSTEVEAQLSDRINNPSTIKSGARPVAGNFGFFLALGIDQIEDLTEEATEVENAIPLINVRYYLRDDLVVRGGIASWKKSRILEGEIDTSSAFGNLNPGGQGFGANYEHREVDAYTLLNIGIEKHFKPTNILDGYVGVSLPLGYSRGALYTNRGADGTADFLTVETSRFSFVYGAEFFVGINAFVADLPLALGVEMGFRGLGKLGDKFKTTYEGQTNGQGYSGEVFQNNIDDFEDTQAQFEADNIAFSSLKARSFDTQGMIRFSINYYFN